MKKRKKRKKQPDTMVQAYYCLKGQYFTHVDDYTTFDEFNSKVESNSSKIEIIIPHEVTENQVIKKDLYFKMSTEAKEVISIVINCPAELIGIITTPKRKQVKKAKLIPYIQKKWGLEVTNQILAEINELLKLF